MGLQMNLDTEDCTALCNFPSILIIEDHEPSLNRLAAVLEKEGYRVHTASNGLEGVRLYFERRPDIVLTDVNLPYKDGFEVLRNVKRSRRDVEVIVTSGSCEESIGVRASEEGAMEFLRKPIDLEQLLTIIHMACSRLLTITI